MSTLDEFREESRAWLQENLPASLKTGGDIFQGGRKTPIYHPDTLRWVAACYERGFTAPDWPKEYGGAQLSAAECKVLREEMLVAKAPIPLTGHGLTMIGPTLLEYGTDDQKARHLPKIASGEYRWC